MCSRNINWKLFSVKLTTFCRTIKNKHPLIKMLPEGGGYLVWCSSKKKQKPKVWDEWSANWSHLFHYLDNRNGVISPRSPVFSLHRRVLYRPVLCQTSKMETNNERMQNWFCYLTNASILIALKLFKIDRECSGDIYRILVQERQNMNWNKNYWK